MKPAPVQADRGLISVRGTSEFVIHRCDDPRLRFFIKPFEHTASPPPAGSPRRQQLTADEKSSLVAFMRQL